MKTLKVIVILLVLAVIAAAVYIYSGVYPIGADVPHTSAVSWVIQKIRNRSVVEHAQGIKVPAGLDDPKRVLIGAGQYAAMCSGCHLAPGYDSDEMREGMYPTPPKLAKDTGLSPEKIFWVLKHGIKMSGMPAWGATHSDDELWAITAFVMQLPKLNAEQYKAIVAKAPPDDDMTMLPMPGGKPMGDQ